MYLADCGAAGLMMDVKALQSWSDNGTTYIEIRLAAWQLGIYDQEGEFYCLSDQRT